MVAGGGIWATHARLGADSSLFAMVSELRSYPEEDRKNAVKAYLSINPDVFGPLVAELASSWSQF